MVQKGPIYPEKADDHPEITTYLKRKYGDDLLWPVIWHYRDNMTIHSIGFEVNNKSYTNKNIHRDHSIIKEMDTKYVYNYDFTTEPKEVVPLKDKYVFKYTQTAIDRCENSFDYVSNKTLNTTGISTIDIDYLWLDSFGYIKGLEVTTLFSPMDSRERAIELLKAIIDKRFSRTGAYHLDLITKAAEEHFDAKLIFVCVNNEPCKNNILHNSNVLWFKLDRNLARKIHDGNLPEDSELIFESFNALLSRL